MNSRCVVPEGYFKITFPESLSLFSLGGLHIGAMNAQNVQPLTCLSLAEF